MELLVNIDLVKAGSSDCKITILDTLKDGS